MGFKPIEFHLTALFLNLQSPKLTRVLGHGCSTVAEHTPYKQEVVGLNPAGCGAFFFCHLLPLSFTTGVSLIRSVKEVHL